MGVYNIFSSVVYSQTTRLRPLERIAMRPNAFSLSSVILGSWLPAALAGQTVTHDANFSPDQILRVTVAQAPSAWESRTDVVVNRTSPDLTLHIPPERSTWVRAYNDMADQNLTMVSRLSSTPRTLEWLAEFVALVWLSPKIGAFLPTGLLKLLNGLFHLVTSSTYKIAAENDDAGTYFYHSHVEMQAMSCSGPLIVDDCGVSPFEYDDERVFPFQDFFTQDRR